MIIELKRCEDLEREKLRKRARKKQAEVWIKNLIWQETIEGLKKSENIENVKITKEMLDDVITEVVKNTEEKKIRVHTSKMKTVEFKVGRIAIGCKKDVQKKGSLKKKRKNESPNKEEKSDRKNFITTWKENVKKKKKSTERKKQ